MSTSSRLHPRFIDTILEKRSREDFESVNFLRQTRRSDKSDQRTLLAQMSEKYPSVMPANFGLICRDVLRSPSGQPKIKPRFWSAWEIRRALDYEEDRREILWGVSLLFPAESLERLHAQYREIKHRYLVLLFFVELLQYVRTEMNIRVVVGMPLSREDMHEFNELSNRLAIITRTIH